MRIDVNEVINKIAALGVYVDAVNAAQDDDEAGLAYIINMALGRPGTSGVAWNELTAIADRLTGADET